MSAPNRDALLDTALTLLQQGKAGKAAKLLQPLIEANSEDAEALSIFGLARQASGNSDGLLMLQKAISLEPDEPRFHLHFGFALQRMGRMSDAIAAFSEAAKLEGGSPATLLPLAQALQDSGHGAKAAAIYDQLHQQHPQGGEFLYRKGEALHSVGDFQNALAAVEAYIDMQPERADKKILKANLLIHLMRYEEAEAIISPLYQQNPNNPEIALEAAKLAHWQGRFDDNREILQQALKTNPNHAGLLSAYLQNHKSADDSHITIAAHLVQQSALPLIERQTLSYALANLFDHKGDLERAWKLFRHANQMSPVSFDLAAEQTRFDRALALYEKLNAVTEKSDPDEQIYIIGPPRSGGSLMQSVLCAADDAASLGERGALLPYFFRAMEFDADKSAPELQTLLPQLQPSDGRGMRRLAKTASCVVDKTPHHAYIAGLIQKIHPSAKFLHMRRDPREVMLSIYCNNFPTAFSYAADLNSIADYLTLHENMIIRWQNAGVKINIAQYEDFQQDPEQKGAEIFTKLGRKFDKTYLAPEKRDHMVRTFSAAKIRAPIKTGATMRFDKYKNFIEGAEALEEKLSPLPSSPK